MQYLIKISYDGSKYYGYAIQPNVNTVSRELNLAFKKIFNKTIKINSPSRTDRYVHAISLPLTFNIREELNLKKFKKQLNNLLPKYIRVNEAQSVNDEFNVKAPIKKKYIYLVNLKNKKDSNYYYNYSYSLNLDKLNEVKDLFIGKKNYASFTGKSNYQNYERTIFEINFKLKRNILTIEVIGEGFMRYMVRNIAGVLLTYNRGKLSYDELLDLFINPIKGKAHYKAPGSGLYLYEIYY